MRIFQILAHFVDFGVQSLHMKVDIAWIKVNVHIYFKLHQIFYVKYGKKFN